MGNRGGLTEKEKEVEGEYFKITKLGIQVPWEWIKKLKMRGGHIFYPAKTKPRRDHIFEAVLYLRAIFAETFGEPRWDLIERIIGLYWEEVFKGGNIESWYYYRETKDFNFWLMKRKEREKFFFQNLKKEFLMVTRKVQNNSIMNFGG